MRLKVSADASSSAPDCSFNSRLVRLKAGGPKRLSIGKVCFNSRLVRLKAVSEAGVYEIYLFQFQIGAIKRLPSCLTQCLPLWFQFQIGAIKSGNVLHLNAGYPRFNSRLVRLKVTGEHTGGTHYGRFNSRLVRLKGVASFRLG